MDNSNKMSRDDESDKYPVSIKGVLIHDDEILLLKNERGEWELPGGKLEVGEFPNSCLRREILEETNLQAQVIRALPSYIYLVGNAVPVLIVPFLCKVDNFSDYNLSHEHKEINIFSLDEVEGINLPEGYLKTIRAAVEELKGNCLNDYVSHLWCA